MSAWIEGLLGAVMGGAKSVEESIKEEEAAKRKEEEEKRREERAISLKEREAKIKEERDRRLQEEQQKKVAGYMAPQEQTVLSQSPDEPEGMITKEMRGGGLQEGIKRAMAAGDVESAKKFSEELGREIERETKLSAERRALEKADRDAAKKPEEPTQVATYKGIFKAAYPGEKDKEGNPLDPEAYAKYEQQRFEDLAGKRTYIRPAGGGGGPAGQRPPTAGQLMAAEGKLAKSFEPEFTEGTGDKKTVNRFLVRKAEEFAVNKIDEADPSKKLDFLKIKTEAVNKVSEAKKKAEADAIKEWERLSKEKTKDLPSKGRYVRDNYERYFDRYYSGTELPDPLGIRNR